MTIQDINLEGQELRDEDVISCSLEKSRESRGDSQSTMDRSEVRLELEKIISKIPVVLDVKPPKFRRRYRQIQRTFPFSSELNFSDESTTCSQELFYGSQSWLDFPADYTTPGYFFKSSMHSRTSRSTNNMSDFFIDYSHDAAQYPSARWICSSVEELVKRMGLIEISLSLDPFKQHFCTRLIGSRLTSMIEMKSPDLLNNQELAKSLSKQVPKEKLLDRSALSLASTGSTSSYLFVSTRHNFATSALIYCVWERDVPHFLFIADDDGAEIYVASPLKAITYTCKPLDYIYLFHSWKASRKVSKKNTAHAPLLVGKMTVSSSLVVDVDRSRFLETEFVLFGMNEERSAEKEKLTPNLKRSDGQSRKLTEIFRPNRLMKHDPKHSSTASYSRSRELWKFCPDDTQPLDIVEAGWDGHPLNDFSPNFELAATVIRDYGYSSSKGTASGGWGLKFLEQELPSSSYENSESRSRSYTKRNSRNATVLIPAGTHGGLVTASGTSSLVERWRSGGHCDCGGWDVGCPLKVLSNNSVCSKDLEEDCQPFELPMEGGKPGLKMLKVSKDMHAVNFESTLSSLQAFSAAVALMHSQTPHLLPKL